jgi:5-methylcytosine-specific restriction endonuclease McrA
VGGRRRARRKSTLRRSAGLRRKSPLHSGAAPRRRRPIAREGVRGRARRRVWAVITRLAIEAAGGACQMAVPGVCTRRAVTGHHRLPRARGGPDTIDNCVACCHACHRYVTDHPSWAYERGFTLRRAGGEGGPRG